MIYGLFKKFYPDYCEDLGHQKKRFFFSPFRSVYIFCFHLFFHLLSVHSPAVFLPFFHPVLYAHFSLSLDSTPPHSKFSWNDRPTTLKDVTARKHQIQNCSHVHDRLNESLLSCQGRKFNHKAEQRDDEENE